MTLPSEVQRAQHLVNRLHTACTLAKRFRQSSVKLDLEAAEELLQLLADSLKTIDQFDLVEFDGTIEPEKVRRLPSPIQTREVT